MQADGAVIARAIESWGLVPRVLGAAFGTEDPDAVAAAVSAFCLRHLGAPVAEYVLFDGGVGTVHGVRLADGRRVAVKVHRGDADVSYLAAAQRIRGALAAAGIPAPRPLLAPTPLARGIATVEEFQDGGEYVPAHDPEQRARIAADLRRLVVAATPHRELLGSLRGGLTGMSETKSWTPHDRRFDFSLPGADWVDTAAERARVTLRASREAPVLGHGDWRVQHLRYAGDRLVAIHDWDSLAVRPEAALAGAIAGIFTTDWSQSDRCRIPTAEEAAAFLDAYEAARERPFSGGERELARAALVHQTAYGARCEWSDLLTDFGRRPAAAPPASLPPGGFLALLDELVRG